MARDKIATNDRQLACAHIQSEEGQNYLGAMAAAANYAWVNRSAMTFLTRQAPKCPRLILTFSSRQLICVLMQASVRKSV
jgi:hypothetical protein